MCWDRQRLPIRSNKDDMACTPLSPGNVVSSSNGFQAFNPPITRIVLHLFEDFVSFAHGDYDTKYNSVVQVKRYG